MIGTVLDKPISRENRMRENENRIKERFGISTDQEDIKASIHSDRDLIRPQPVQPSSYPNREVEPENLDITVSTIPGFPRHGTCTRSSYYRDSRQQELRDEKIEY